MAKRGDKLDGFVFFPNDWLGSTRGMPWKVKGAYIDLLATCWNLNGLDVNLHAICAQIGCKPTRQLRAIWQHLECKFPVAEDGKRRNPKLEAIRRKQLELQRMKRAAAQVRWTKPRDD